MSTPAVPDPPATPDRAAPVLGSARADLWTQVLLVLGVSLGASAVYAVLSLAEHLARGPLAEAQATLNPALSPLPLLDLARQLAGIGLDLVPVLLALYLLAGSAAALPAVLRRIGLDARMPWPDLGLGAVLFLLMGLGTLALYAAGRALGLTAAVSTSGLGEHWWTVPVLLASALRHALVEEVVVVAFLADRLTRLGWRWPAVLAATAVFRGLYHVYQGVGPFLGNVVMGLVFAELYRRTGRVMPLVVAHFLLDAVGFLGSAWLLG
ncbi:CAAX protease [Kocuria flava]|uniref:CAAX protease n=1 Tax=Kocuria flava TaxID=446860 RepID=A0A2N4T4I3_9MICC|nr:CPBP family intramembrane glutamic endopeptidase [Kocuria flava]PLC13135.1 CAAX protease [Kocuria flava]